MQGAFFFGILICVISILCSFIVAIMDYRADKVEGKLKEKLEVNEDDAINCKDI